MVLTDEELIKKICAGETKQFAVLVERHQNKAFTLAMRLLKNHEDAEEATQDAFVRSYKALNNFQGTSAFGTWLYRIVYNVCLTKLSARKESFKSLDEATDDEEAPKELAVEPALVDTTYEQNEMKSLVRATVDKLPEHYRLILTLFYLEELRYEEICEVTGLPVGTVKTQLFRARTMLQKMLTKRYSREEVII